MGGASVVVLYMVQVLRLWVKASACGVGFCMCGATFARGRSGRVLFKIKRELGLCANGAACGGFLRYHVSAAFEP